MTAFVALPVACGLRSPATAFCRVEFVSFLLSCDAALKGRSSTVASSSVEFSVEERRFSAAIWSPLIGASAPRCRQRDAGEFAAEVGGVALAVFGVVQDGVDVVEDVPLGDGGVVVAGAELFEGPVGDVLAAVGAVLGVGVEGEALRAATCAREMKVNEMARSHAHEWFLGAWGRYADHVVLRVWCREEGF